MGGTHVVFLPGKGQDSTAFDTALGSLGVLGLHAMCAGMPSKNWDETTGAWRALPAPHQRGA